MWITRRVALPGAPPPRRRLRDRLLGRPAAVAGPPFTWPELDRAARAFPVTARPDGSWWVRYPDEGEPWFVLRGTPDGDAVLTTSHGNPRFLRNWTDSFDAALDLARALDARVFADTGEEVRADTIDALLTPLGPLCQRESEVFHRVQAEIHADGLAGLEYPLGALDVVAEFFTLVLDGGFPYEVEGYGIRSQGPGEVVSRDGLDLAHLLRRDDGDFSVAPSRGPAPFAAQAEACFAVVAACPGAAVRFAGITLDEPGLARVRDAARGLGVECYERLGSGARRLTG